MRPHQDGSTLAHQLDINTRKRRSFHIDEKRRNTTPWLENVVSRMNVIRAANVSKVRRQYAVIVAIVGIPG